MKSAYFGWEVDHIRNRQVTWTAPLLHPIVIRGYQFDLAMAAMDNAFPGQAGVSMVLFSCWLGGQASTPDFGDPKFTVPTDEDVGMHGNSMASQGLCHAILKTNVYPFVNPVNKVITMSGLELPANGSLVMTATHSGFQIDFEVQGNIFYDEGG